MQDNVCAGAGAGAAARARLFTQDLHRALEARFKYQSVRSDRPRAREPAEAHKFPLTTCSRRQYGRPTNMWTVPKAFPR